jgi:hypothetical protein
MRLKDAISGYNKQGNAKINIKRGIESPQRRPTNKCEVIYKL